MTHDSSAGQTDQRSERSEYLSPKGLTKFRTSPALHKQNNFSVNVNVSFFST